jgi:UDP-N-acetylmuramoyl-tripeptide--D-alanyl-D-alanine ligase
MVGAVLNEKMPCLVSRDNYNSPSGVAYNIFHLTDEHRAAVLEVGMKGFGIMKLSSGIVKPDIVILTAIQRCHMASLGSIENIIKAKSEVFEHLSEHGTLIINGDDENCKKFLADNFKGEVLRFGFDKSFDAYAANISCKDFKTHFRAILKGFDIDCTINTVCRYNVANALAAVLAGVKMGVSPREISKGLSRFETLDRRLRVQKGINNTIIINDNFNANPDSTSLLIQDIPEFAGERPVVLVIGDMERPDDEIQSYAEKVHFAVGEQIVKIMPEYLVAVGRWAAEYVSGAVSGGFPKEKAAYFRTVEEADGKILDYVIPGSVVIFKASVYTKVRKLIKNLKES